MNIYISVLTLFLTWQDKSSPNQHPTPPTTLFPDVPHPEKECKRQEPTIFSPHDSK
jgi:hypothetical protein